jgi:hypothetical protein
MGSLTVSGIVFACVFGGGSFGLFLRKVLAEAGGKDNVTLIVARHRFPDKQPR